jgi:hypothetical protein
VEVGVEGGGRQHVGRRRVGGQGLEEQVPLLKISRPEKGEGNKIIVIMAKIVHTVIKSYSV